MRADMFKVIVERPRRWKGGDESADRRRNDFEGPPRLGMRAGYGYRALNENLQPLRRYLRSHVGRPWNKVYSEIANNIDRRNTVQQHIYQHLDDFVAINVAWKDGHLFDLRRHLSWSPGHLYQELYVDPRTGILRVNEDYGGRRRAYRASERERESKVEARRRTVDEFTQLHLLEGEWYEVRLAPLPPIETKETVVRGRSVRKEVAAARFDVVLKRMTSLKDFENADERGTLYGSKSVFAATKRQLCRREKKNHGLMSD